MISPILPVLLAPVVPPISPAPPGPLERRNPYVGVTEPFFVRIDSEVARLARATAEHQQMPLREVTERALKAFIAEVTEPERRAAALHAMEDALLGRMDRRLGKHYERVADLYARQAFDTAQTLDLVKRVLWYSIRDNHIFEKYLDDSRKEATRVLKQRAEVPLPGSAAEDAVKKAQDAAHKLKEEIDHLNKEIKKLEQTNDALVGRARKAEVRAADVEQDLFRESAKAEKIEARFTWAIQQFEAQRGFSRRPIADFLRIWDDQNGRP
jgi:hypothetical protein